MGARVYDSPLRYKVDSATREDVEHLVEIDAYEGNGRCACEHFTFKLEKLVNVPGFKPSNATRCHHIMEARDEMLDQMIKLIKSRQKANGSAKQEHQV